MAGRRPVGLDYLGLIPSQPKLELGLGLSLAIIVGKKMVLFNKIRCFQKKILLESL